MKLEFPDGAAAKPVALAFDDAKTLRSPRKPHPGDKSARHGALLSSVVDDPQLPAIVLPKENAAAAFRARREKVRQYAGDVVQGLPHLRKHLSDLMAIEGWQDDQQIAAEVVSTESQIRQHEKVPAVRDQMLFQMLSSAQTGEGLLEALMFAETVSARAEEYRDGYRHQYPRIHRLSAEEGKQFLESLKVDGKLDFRQLAVSGLSFRGFVFRYFQPDGGFVNDTPFQRSVKKLAADRRKEFAARDLEERQKQEFSEKGAIEVLMKDDRFTPIGALNNEFKSGLYRAHSPGREGRRAEGLMILDVSQKEIRGMPVYFVKLVAVHGSDHDFASLVGWNAALDQVLRGALSEKALERIEGEIKREKVTRLVTVIHRRFRHEADKA